MAKVGSLTSLGKLVYTIPQSAFSVQIRRRIRLLEKEIQELDYKRALAQKRLAAARNILEWEAKCRQLLRRSELRNGATRHRKGRPRIKLSPEQIVTIQERWADGKATRRQLASEHGVSPSLVDYYLDRFK